MKRFKRSDSLLVVVNRILQTIEVFFAPSQLDLDQQKLARCPPHPRNQKHRKQCKNDGSRIHEVESYFYSSENGSQLNRTRSLE